MNGVERKSREYVPQLCRGLSERQKIWFGAVFQREMVLRFQRLYDGWTYVGDFRVDPPSSLGGVKSVEDYYLEECGRRGIGGVLPSTEELDEVRDRFGWDDCYGGKRDAV